MPLKTPGAYSAHMRNEMDGCEEWIRVRGGGRELRERERDIEKQRERERENVLSHCSRVRLKIEALGSDF